MKEFMCHQNLVFNFGPRVNFIIGEDCLPSSTYLPIHAYKVTTEVARVQSSPRLLWHSVVRLRRPVVALA
jgi:hypothetical protein